MRTIGIINNFNFTIMRTDPTAKDKVLAIYNRLDDIFLDPWNKMDLQQQKDLILNAVLQKKSFIMNTARQEDKLAKHISKEKYIPNLNIIFSSYFQFSSNYKN